MRTDMHSFSEKLKFFGAFIRSPKTIGSVIPTSSRVISHIIEQIDWKAARLIVEYGPGMGTITRPILERLHPDARLIAIDMNAGFINHLKQSIPDPRLVAVHGSAADVERIITSHIPGSRANYIVSGLPFSTLPEGIDNHIMSETARALSPDGAFLVYQYSRYVVPLLRSHFTSVDEARIWRNIPPCYIFRATK